MHDSKIDLKGFESSGLGFKNPFQAALGSIGHYHHGNRTPKTFPTVVCDREFYNPTDGEGGGVPKVGDPNTAP